MRAQAWGPGAHGCSTPSPAPSACYDDISGFDPWPRRPPGHQGRRAAAPRAADRPFRPPHGGARARDPRAEGRRARGPPRLADPAGEVRHAAPRPRARAACASSRRPAPGGASRPGSGTGPGWRASAPRRSSGPASVADSLERLLTLTHEEADRKLRTIPGIGVWTSAEARQRAAGDPDAVSVGDYHLKNIVGWALAGRPRSTDEEMLALLEPFKGHRHRATRLIEAERPAARRAAARGAVRSATTAAARACPSADTGLRAGRLAARAAEPRLSCLKVRSMSASQHRTRVEDERASARRPMRPGAGPCPGRRQAARPGRGRRSCCTPAATTCERCSATPRVPGTRGWRRPAGPGSSPTRRRSSSRSPGCAGTAATTAPSRPSPARLDSPYLQPGRGARHRPPRARRSAARKPCSPSATGPEDRWPQAREWLDAHGYDDTLAYVRAMAIRVLEETGLLPHLNPGVHDLARLPAAQAGRAVAWA